MKIKIKDLEFYCIIGILDFERVKTQKVIVNVSFKYNYLNKDTFIDYSQISNDIKNIMIEKKFELLEEAIIYIKRHLKNNYKIKKLKLEISKPDILKDCIVSLKK